MFGSWNFILVQTAIVIGWIGVNLAAVTYRWDPYTDRIRAEHDYQVNQKALWYLTVLHRDAHGMDCDCDEKAVTEGGQDGMVPPGTVPHGTVPPG